MGLGILTLTALLHQYVKKILMKPHKQALKPKLVRVGNYIDSAGNPPPMLKFNFRFISKLGQVLVWVTEASFPFLVVFHSVLMAL